MLFLSLIFWLHLCFFFSPLNFEKPYSHGYSHVSQLEYIFQACKPNSAYKTTNDNQTVNNSFSVHTNKYLIVLLTFHWRDLYNRTNMHQVNYVQTPHYVLTFLTSVIYIFSVGKILAMNNYLKISLLRSTRENLRQTETPRGQNHLLLMGIQ